MRLSLHPLAPLALLTGLALACGEETIPDAGAPPDAFVPVEQRPTAEQEKALAGALHKRHLEDEKEPAKCRDCHSISGHDKTDPRHRCLSCHEGKRSAVHEKVADKDAKECLTCHDFFAEVAEPWSCASCHVEGSTPPAWINTLPNAPKVQIHSKEACKSCHSPHGETFLDPGPCLECHEDTKPSNHHAKELTEPKQCLECHGGHVPAKTAGAKCRSCHEGVPTAATFEGHDTCMSCHTPHGGRRAKRCQTCHEEQQTLASHKQDAHGECINCHQAHVVTSSPAKKCATCHEKVTPHHPEDPRLGTCAGCHPQHPFDGKLEVARTCAGEGCHEVASDTAQHGGVACKQCHPKHDFGLKEVGAPLCRSCHTAPPKAGKLLLTATRVDPVEGHEKCRDCHVESAHTPKADPAACAKCHEPEVKTMTKGHEACTECHAPHEGKVGKDCQTCHTDKLTGRHKKDLPNCKQCHRSHGPEGTEAPKACTSCHDQALPGLHALKDHNACANCHGFHDKGPRRGRSSCITECHQEQLNHEPAAASCVGCHPFEKKVAP
jgi:hypothetical protein